jgi:hypothetical protein
MPWHSRKFLVTVLVVACGTGLAFMGLLDAVVAGFLGAVLATYNGANVISKQVTK